MLAAAGSVNSRPSTNSQGGLPMRVMPLGHRGVNRNRFVLLCVVAATATFLTLPGPALAGTLDQQQTISNFGGLQVSSHNSKAQTFTAGLTGQLDQVDLALSLMSVSTPMTVQIRDGSATAPGDTVLASASVPTSAATSSE